MDAKICGIKDSKTLNYIINHNHPPKFIGFITNYPKSKRYIEYESLKKLIDLDKDDRIIKRRLAQKVEFLKQDVQQPSSQELENFYNENQSKYIVEDLYSFSHHFFSKESDSETKAKLGLIDVLSGDAIKSDPFILGNELNLISKNDIQKNFGISFYESLTTIDENQWSGPIASDYGLHIVFIKKKILIMD